VPRYQFATVTLANMSAPFYKLQLSGAYPTPGGAIPSPTSQ
jgi:hypothetical protein